MIDYIWVIPVALTLLAFRYLFSGEKDLAGIIDSTAMALCSRGWDISLLSVFGGRKWITESMKSEGTLYDESTAGYTCGECGKDFHLGVSVSYAA